MERSFEVLMVICLLLLASVAWAGEAKQSRDAMELWQQGALRGANVLPPTNTLDDMKALRSWGANLAEVAVMDVYNPRPPYQLQPEELAKLDRAVEAAEQAGLFVALTCRTGPGRADFEESQEIWSDPKAQDAYAQMWAGLAKHYLGRPAMVGYDLMCEPHPEEAQAPVWNALTKQVTKALREVDARTPILVNSTGWAYPETFDALEPTGDARTVYVVHFYEPHYYTHQKPGDKRTYPGFRLPYEDDKDGAWDSNTIKAKLASVRRFQEKHHVPIFAGEFGCARYAPGALAWLRDQMDLYEQWHWSWAYWAFREWSVMDIEMTSDPEDKQRHADTPLLRLFKGYFAKDTDFPAPTG